MPTRKEWLQARIGEEHDRRRKIPKEAHETIRLEHKYGMSQRALAGKYKCSRRTIVFILHPERLSALRGKGTWKHYYSKEKHRDYMRKHRKYIREIAFKGRKDFRKGVGA